MTGPGSSAPHATRSGARTLPTPRYFVGAAIEVASGAVFAGCNVENARTGSPSAPERSAIVQMVAAGERDPTAIVVVTPGPILGTPCGVCRQTQQSGLGARNTYSIICSCKIVDCCCSIEVSYVVYIH